MENNFRNYLSPVVAPQFLCLARASVGRGGVGGGGGGGSGSASSVGGGDGM